MGFMASRNKALFQGIETHLGQVAHQIRSVYVSNRKNPISKVPRILDQPMIKFTRAWGLFDGFVKGLQVLMSQQPFYFCQNIIILI
jgi:hypothetical protein